MNSEWTKMFTVRGAWIVYILVIWSQHNTHHTVRYNENGVVLKTSVYIAKICFFTCVYRNRYTDGIGFVIERRYTRFCFGCLRDNKFEKMKKKVKQWLIAKMIRKRVCPPHFRKKKIDISLHCRVHLGEMILIYYKSWMDYSASVFMLVSISKKFF